MEVNHEPPPQHYARLRARDHDNVPVLHPRAAVGGDRPVHGRSGGKEMRREDPESYPSENN